MKSEIATLCIAAALCLDTLSQFRQIGKTLRAKNSSQVSSMAYLLKIIKVVFSMTGLALYSNYVGMGMEGWMLVVYVTVLTIIAKYKPRGWKLWR